MKKLKLTYNQIKEWGLNKIPTAMVWLDLIIIAVFYTLVIAHFPTQNGDNIEHVHSSFLVALGNVPYRDFFQHHNPLMWYIFSPLVKFFSYDSTIVEVVCFISLLVFLKSLVFTYRISLEFLTDKFWALVTVAVVAIPGRKLFAIDFRPDNYMVFCLMGGIYYLFSFLRDKKQGQLVISFLWFFISFLFAQKALFPLLCLGIVVLYFWYKKEISTLVLLKALILPVVGFLGFVYYLYHFDMLETYYVSNYTFNLNLVKGFEFHKVVSLTPAIKIFVGLGWIGAIMALVCGNIYWRILAFLFVVEFFQREFYFSPYIYYYWLLCYFAALCGVPVLCKIDNKNRCVRFVLVAIFYYFLCSSIHFYVKMKIAEQKSEQANMYLPDYIARHITPCDYVFNGDGFMYNLFGKDPSYYWQLIGQLDVIGEETGIQPRPNINELILELKPKFVYGRSYFHKFSKESGRNKVVHYVDPNLISEFYEYSGFGNVYRLREEFDNRKCVKDKKTGVWHFQNYESDVK